MKCTTVRKGRSLLCTYVCIDLVLLYQHYSSTFVNKYLLYTHFASVVIFIKLFLGSCDTAYIQHYSSTFVNKYLLYTHFASVVIFIKLFLGSCDTAYI